MTRINVVPVEELVGPHLVAEYRELPRIFALAHAAHTKSIKWQTRQPEAYTLGRGHVLFFYNKLAWLAVRQNQLVAEMKRRGYEPKFVDCLAKQWRSLIPSEYWQYYDPTDEARAINRERINTRLTAMRHNAYPFFI